MATGPDLPSRIHNFVVNVNKQLAEKKLLSSKDRLDSELTAWAEGIRDDAFSLMNEASDIQDTFSKRSFTTIEMEEAHAEIKEQLAEKVPLLEMVAGRINQLLQNKY